MKRRSNLLGRNEGRGDVTLETWKTRSLGLFIRRCGRELTGRQGRKKQKETRRQWRAPPIQGWKFCTRLDTHLQVLQWIIVIGCFHLSFNTRRELLKFIIVYNRVQNLKPCSHFFAFRNLLFPFLYVKHKGIWIKSSETRETYFFIFNWNGWFERNWNGNAKR